MSTAIANGSNEAERKAAHYAIEVQDGCNLIAIVGCFHRHLIAMRDAGIGGDALRSKKGTPIMATRPRSDSISRLATIALLSGGRKAQDGRVARAKGSEQSATVWSAGSRSIVSWAETGNGASENGAAQSPSRPSARIAILVLSSNAVVNRRRLLGSAITW
jgi:hypothetical protein